MVKRAFYKQVHGRRQGETPVYKFDWTKVLIPILLAWVGWVSLNSVKAERANEQVPILHRRITQEREARLGQYEKMVDLVLDYVVPMEKCEGE